jgi:hypothetical protein
MMVPVIIPASKQAQQAGRSIARQLKDLGAVREDLARPLAIEGKVEQAQLKHMVERNIVRVAKNGNYWLDSERWADAQRKQLLFVLAAILVTTGLMLTVALNTTRSERQAWEKRTPADTTRTSGD